MQCCVLKVQGAVEVQLHAVLNSALDVGAYVIGSKSFRPDVQKPRQMENAVRDIQCHLW